MEFLVNLHQFSDWGLFALRIAVGVIFLVHGAQKWAMWKMEPSEQMPPKMLTMMKFLSVVEPLGGFAVLMGFLTQLAALGLGVIMIGAIFMKKNVMKVPFTAMDKMGWEFDLIILAAAIALFVFGGGVISLDNLFWGL
jgi:putative oxidoreductase